MPREPTNDAATAVQEFYRSDEWQDSVVKEAEERGFQLPDKKQIRCFDDFLAFLKKSKQEEDKCGVEFRPAEGGIVFKEMAATPHGAVDGEIQGQIRNYLQPWLPGRRPAYGRVGANNRGTWHHHTTGNQANLAPDALVRSDGRRIMCLEVAASETANHAIRKCLNYFLHDNNQHGPQVCVVVKLDQVGGASGPVRKLYGWVVARNTAAPAHGQTPAADAVYSGGWLDGTLTVPSELLNCGRWWNLRISFKAVWCALETENLTA